MIEGVTRLSIQRELIIAFPLSLPKDLGLVALVIFSLRKTLNTPSPF
jgi:hypothetical protein